MIFSDRSGDGSIHPIGRLHLPVINPPSSTVDIEHISLNSSTGYKTRGKSLSGSTSITTSAELEQLYYKVKDLLDDGTGSSDEKQPNTNRNNFISPKSNQISKKISKKKTSKYFDDASSCLKKEIGLSEDRVKTIRAGKALTYLFPDNSKPFVEPNKDLYNRKRLGTPAKDLGPKDLKFYSRKKHVSLMNSSPHRPFVMLPCLKDILLKNQENKKGVFQTGSSLVQKLDKLDKSIIKKNVQNRFLSVQPEKKLIKIVKNHLRYGNFNEVLDQDTIKHALDLFRDFEAGKEKLKLDLKDILATQRYDRPEAIWLKYKHFKPSKNSSVYQGRMLDIWNMRMDAEKERLENYRGMIQQICWYREILWFTIEKCPDINPYTYYILDYIKALTEECIKVTKNHMEKVFESIPKPELSKGNNILITKILSDLSSSS
jgi:hypothetical protein